MIPIDVNGRELMAREGETLLEALRRGGIQVPTLCHVPELLPTGACRMCVVEVEGQRNLVPSCAFPVSAGMKVQTHSPRAIRARKTIVELLLSNHPDDCLYCARNGNCQLQSLAEELGVRERRFTGGRSEHRLDRSSPAIVRDPDKCILCGKCVRVCEEIQGVSAIDFIGRGSSTRVGTAFDQGLNVSSCIFCGQCVTACPTGALREQNHVDEVVAALEDPRKTVVVQHAPAVSVTIGEAFGMRAGIDTGDTLTAALRHLGFDRVFDTSFSADLTVMEEGSELVQRIQNGGRLPMLTSCSPGWIKFIEQFYPALLPNLSSCKSPQQMLGAIVKSVWAEQEDIAPRDIFSVAIMPCTAKKFEAKRPEMMRDGVADVDAVLTTRELAQLIRQRGLHLDNLTPEAPDTPFGRRSSAGKLFGASGGVMEAALRTAHHLVTGAPLDVPAFESVRGLDRVKSARVKIGDLDLGVAVVSGLANARLLLDEIQAGRDDLHFIEIMTCPGGCISGGGQPIGVDGEAVRKRMHALYAIDRHDVLRTAHENETVQRLYDEFLGAPLSERAHRLLHTHYAEREVLR